jgi:hypothetical protein
LVPRQSVCCEVELGQSRFVFYCTVVMIDTSIAPRCECFEWDGC